MHDRAPPRIAITVGEPAGVGPEISLAAARAVAADGTVRPVLIGDGGMLAARARRADIAIVLVAYDPACSPAAGAVEVIDLALAAPCEPGRVDAANGRRVLAWLDRAIDGARSGEFDAIVTAPVQKSAINDAGVAFTGHTEYLAERTGTRRVVMMLAGPMRAAADAMLRVALVTTHLALKDVPAAITRAAVLDTLTIVDRDLRERFDIVAPRIVVTGLNPHAGEGGHLGREEIDAVGPAIADARAAGTDARGPYPADTLFQPRYLDDCDAVVAMYHDQGLPVLKFATFGHGVNVTLGLPIVRTSVDHGTALDLAARPDVMRHVDIGSMRAALDLAAAMARTSRSRIAARIGVSGHVARKRFGQNFLVDRAVIAAIVSAIAPRPDDAMVEIGPGLAALTEPLLVAREGLPGVRRPLHAIELDRDLAARLERRFGADRLVVHQADALRFDFASLLDAGERLRVVGNLPYNISTPLLFHLLEIAERVVDQHFMLQREVVARMVAAPGTSDYGRLSVMLQVRYAMEWLFDVPPDAFDPPPAVTSAIVRMIPLPRPPIRDEDGFARLVALAFSQRRKMLRKTLAAHAEAMEAVGVAPTARAEEIPVETWIALANRLESGSRR